MMGKGGRKIGKVAFLVDVSGSMYAYQEKLNQAVDEIVGLSLSMPDTEIRIIQWDTTVKSVVDVKGDGAKKTKEWAWGGRGGTYIAPALQAAKEWRADVQVIWTDGQMSLPERILTPTLWAITDTNSEIPKTLGSVIRV